MGNRIVLWKIEYKEVVIQREIIPVRRYSWYAITENGSEWGMAFDTFEYAFAHFNERTYRVDGDIYIKA